MSRKSQSSNLTPNEDTNNVAVSLPPSSPDLLNSSSQPLRIPQPTVHESIKAIITTTWLNVLLIFIPLGYIAYGFKWSNISVFSLNFLAIIPLAKLLGFATEDISLRVGQVFIRNRLIKFRKI